MRITCSAGLGASSGTEASIHRARALGPQPQRSRTRRRCVRPAARALARHRDRLRRQRGRAADRPIESLRTLPPCASCAPPARRWHWRHEHATSTPRAAHSASCPRDRPPLGVGLGEDRIHVCFERVRSLVGLDRRVDTDQSSAALPEACVAAPFGEDDVQRTCTSWR